MSETCENNFNLYLKIIEYKRSIGVTQWAVLSIFITVSEVVFVLSLKQSDFFHGIIVRIFAILIYWLGFLLYNRYRSLNLYVSNFLIELEKKNGFDFQQNLNSQFHEKGISSKNILIVAGIIYMLLVIVISVI